MRIDILNSLYDVKGENLVLVNSELINSKLASYDYIDKFHIKKIYPDTLNIKIFTKKPIAILIVNNEKFFFTSNGEKINFYKGKKNQLLPYVYGGEDFFQDFYQSIKTLNFPVNEVDKFIFYKINRWDIEMKNKTIIKLSSDNFKNNIKNFIEINNKEEFKKFKIFDYRIKGNLILE